MASVAFLTIGLLQEPIGHPRIEGFIDRTPAVLAGAEHSAGYIMRMPDPQPNEWIPPVIFQTQYASQRLSITLSLWHDLESIAAFAYHGLHAEALSKRREWFSAPLGPAYVAWWVADDHIPTWHEAAARYDRLQQAGATPEAFDFKKAFTSDGQPVKLDPEIVKRKVNQNHSRSQERTMEPSAIETLISKYVGAWSEPDAAARQQLLEAIWSPGGTYTDPLTHAASRAELDAVIEQFLQSNPGAQFSINGKIDAHHQHIRFYWVLHMSNGRELNGMDYGELAPDGKLQKIVGFF